MLYLYTYDKAVNTLVFTAGVFCCLIGMTALKNYDNITRILNFNKKIKNIIFFYFYVVSYAIIVNRSILI